MPDYLSILKQYFGYSGFRGIQKEIIESIGGGRDTLGLMPTGGGKSVTFQVPALAMEGTCLVVTPLIALMKDQVTHLHDKGIKALAIHSGMERREIEQTLDNCIYGDYKFLYVSPERLSSPLFQSKVVRMRISFITVDEAHCISQWGYDFRPSYLQIAQVRHLLPGVPVLALTATATPRVADDIQNRLEFKKRNVFRMSFERKNLAYMVCYTDDKISELLKLVRAVPGSVIVYTRNREKTVDTAKWLTDNGYPALHYHAGLYQTDKDERQRLWQTGQVRIMVATNAFGMGIDKPDVRLVVHIDTPDSVEAYFQEAGRAGRDGLPAQAVLLYDSADTAKLTKRIDEAFPPKIYIRRVYEDLCSYYQLAVGDGLNVSYEFDETKFCSRFKHFPVRLHSALEILTRGGYIDYRDKDDSQSRVMFLLNKDDLYRLSHLPDPAERLLNALLRLYGGLFSQYVYIDERDLGDHVGMDRHQVYEILKDLNRQFILHYIPRKNVPHIMFPIRRVDTDEIRLGPELYDIRKEEYAERIRAIVDYATCTTRCRSRMLLAYFGEMQSENCHRCDYCERIYSASPECGSQERAAEAIVSLLSDGVSHSLSELRNLPFVGDAVARALQQLADDAEVTLSDGKVFLN